MSSTAALQKKTPPRNEPLLTLDGFVKADLS